MSCGLQICLANVLISLWSFSTKQQLHYKVGQMKEGNWKHSK